MLEKIGKYCCSILVFIINILLMVLGYQVIKDQEKSSTEIKKEDISEEIQALDQKILEAQNKLATERENKLRDLNTEPKKIQQQQVTTQTKTTAPKSSTKTKTS